MNHRYRLSSSKDFKRVRRTGKSYAHPFAVLIVEKNELNRIRIGVAAGKSSGNAVQRNRAKRLLRESIRRHLTDIESGNDIILLARKRTCETNWNALSQAIDELLRRSGILKKQE
ncbi:MAG: ribonuclease P protein component [Anaerolineales bacterium]|nr:ribonuclease P protein component [Anaerolineales bacterium]